MVSWEKPVKPCENVFLACKNGVSHAKMGFWHAKMDFCVRKWGLACKNAESRVETGVSMPETWTSLSKRAFLVPGRVPAAPAGVVFAGLGHAWAKDSSWGHGVPCGKQEFLVKPRTAM